MAQDTLGFVLSDETAANLSEALTRLKDYQDAGWTISDLRIEKKTQKGEQVQVGVIEVER